MELALDILWEVSVLSDQAEMLNFLLKNFSSQYNCSEVYNNWTKLCVYMLKNFSNQYNCSEVYNNWTKLCVYMLISS